jgi:hypothetical protein
LNFRKPLGSLFLLLGVLLAGYGMIYPAAQGAVPAGFNVNLAWGSSMAVFGAILLLVGRR